MIVSSKAPGTQRRADSASEASNSARSLVSIPRWGVSPGKARSRTAMSRATYRRLRSAAVTLVDDQLSS